MFWSVLKKARKSAVCAVLFCVYVFYVNYFGVVAFFSPSMFIIPTALATFFIWGLIISFRARFEEGRAAKKAMLVAGLAVALIPVAAWEIGKDINEAAIAVKTRKHEKQLVRMCERIVKEKPEGVYFSLREYEEYYIWAAGAKPTRQFGYHEAGVVYLDFNGSPDSGSGIIYKPENKRIRYDKKNYLHMFGPWYRFKVVCE